MTRPARRRRSRTPSVTPGQLATGVVVLAVFAAGIWLGGAAGAAIVAVIAVAAAALLARSWRRLDPRVRTIRVVIVLICLAVAASLLVRQH